tara:strand:+ start:314 stop:526 length:213 start_codon:yes stop_codon:yes gene_type:complete
MFGPFLKRDPKNPFILKFDDKAFKKKYPNYKSRMPVLKPDLEGKIKPVPMPTLKEFKNKYDKFSSKKKKK